jgi:hypothetical protein
MDWKRYDDSDREEGREDMEVRLQEEDDCTGESC